MTSAGAADPLLLRAWHEVAEGLMVLDPEHWRVLHVNEAGAAVHGLRPADVVGRTLPELFPAAVGSDFHRRLRRTRAETGVVEWTGPLPGTAQWITARAVNLDGRVLCSYRDVTREHVLQTERDALLVSLRGALDRTQALLELSERLTATVTVQDVASAVVEVARSGFGAASAALSVVDHERQVLRTPSTDPAAPDGVPRWTDLPLDGPGPLALALASGQPRFDDAQSLRETSPDLLLPGSPDRATPGDVRQVVTVPLVAAGRSVGVLTMVWREDQALSENQRALLVALASYTTQALLRALLLAERTATARTLQSSMVTADLPGAGGLRLSSRYLAARAREQVGGDWFDAIALPDGTTLVVIGDVTGHDIGAAAAMGQLRIALRALAVDRDDPPARLLTRLEAVVESLGGEPILASCIVGRIEPPADGRGPRRLRWANAGHPPPVLVLADGSAQVLEREPDLLLGVVGGERADHRVDLPEGSTLLLYTDGLVERRGGDLEEGIDRLRGAAAALAAADLEAGMDDLLVRLERDAGLLAGAAQEDDVALLATRFGPPA